MNPLLLALQFLTRIPVPARATLNERDTGRSVLCYPLVGLLLGVILLAFATLLSDAPHGLAAALILVVWVSLTGALHLDGLADSADAWVGGHGDCERTLAIMKDPYCGPMGVTAVILLLLVKFTALEALLIRNDLAPLLWATLIGRAALPLLFLTTDYVRAGGLGAAMAQHLPRSGAKAAILASALLVIAFEQWKAAWMLLAAAVVFLFLRSQMRRRIGGTTGDTAGALVEIIEAAVLAAAVLLSVPHTHP